MSYAEQWRDTVCRFTIFNCLRVVKRSAISPSVRRRLLAVFLRSGVFMEEGLGGLASKSHSKVTRSVHNWPNLVLMIWNFFKALSLCYKLKCPLPSPRSYVTAVFRLRTNIVVDALSSIVGDTRKTTTTPRSGISFVFTCSLSSAVVAFGVGCFRPFRFRR